MEESWLRQVAEERIVAQEDWKLREQTKNAEAFLV